MSDKKLSVWRCSECKEQTTYMNKWGAFGHYHSKGEDAWPAHGDPWVPAEEVEVIPVADVRKVEAERDALLAACKTWSEREDDDYASGRSRPSMQDHALFEAIEAASENPESTEEGK